MKSLRIVTRVLAIIPIVTGVVTLFGLQDPIYGFVGLGHVMGPPVLDSNLRFFGGVWLALGVTMMWVASDLDAHAPLFRFAWFAIFVGGIGRIISMAVVGLPPWPFVFLTVLEIVGAPLFLYWHSRVLRVEPR
jgi:Domain of unknown function (DUF4345)